MDGLGIFPHNLLFSRRYTTSGITGVTSVTVSLTENFVHPESNLLCVLGILQVYV